MKKCIGFNLTSLSDEKLSVERIERFNEITFNFFAKHNLDPTYWGVNDKNLSSKLQKFTKRKLENLRKKQYIKLNELIWGLSYAINPKDSDAPAFDSYLNVSLSYLPPLKKFRIVLMLNPNIITDANKDEIGKLFLEYAKLFTVDFGYIYEHESFKHVSAVVLGYDDGKFTPEEDKLGNWWYQLTREEKLKHISGIYPVNLLRRELYKDEIEKILKKDGLIFKNEFLKFYLYKGRGFIKKEIDIDYLDCIVDVDYGEYCS